MVIVKRHLRRGKHGKSIVRHHNRRIHAFRRAGPPPPPTNRHPDIPPSIYKNLQDAEDYLITQGGNDFRPDDDEVTPENLMNKTLLAQNVLAVNAINKKIMELKNLDQDNRDAKKFSKYKKNYSLVIHNGKPVGIRY